MVSEGARHAACIPVTSGERGPHAPRRAASRRPPAPSCGGRRADSGREVQALGGDGPPLALPSVAPPRARGGALRSVAASRRLLSTSLSDNRGYRTWPWRGGLLGRPSADFTERAFRTSLRRAARASGTWGGLSTSGRSRAQCAGEVPAASEARKSAVTRRAKSVVSWRAHGPRQRELE